MSTDHSLSSPPASAPLGTVPGVRGWWDSEEDTEGTRGGGWHKLLLRRAAPLTALQGTSAGRKGGWDAMVVTNSLR